MGVNALDFTDADDSLALTTGWTDGSTGTNDNGAYTKTINTGEYTINVTGTVDESGVTIA